MCCGRTISPTTLPMNKLLSLFLLLPCGVFAQGLVGHGPENRTVLLEEFSAINCGNCPAAHVLADQLIAAHTDQVIAAELHGGGLGVPSAGQPDLRNASSTALWSFYSVASQPRGPVDRRPYSGQVVLSTSQWTAAVNAALSLPTPVNIGLASQFDAGTRTLTVNVEAYYTADGTGGNDYISVFLKESHIIGYQQDYINGAQANYDHKDVMRGYITPLWGDEVTTSTTGTTVYRTYSFTVPVEWNEANCEVVAFIGEYQGEIYMVRQVEAVGGMTTGILAASSAVNARAFPVPAERCRIPANRRRADRHRSSDHGRGWAHGACCSPGRCIEHGGSGCCRPRQRRLRVPVDYRERFAHRSVRRSARSKVILVLDHSSDPASLRKVSAMPKDQ